MGFSGCQYVIVRSRLSQHKMHRADVVRRMPPVTTRRQVAEPQLRRLSCFNLGHRRSDLAGYELKPAPWTLMIEQNSTNAIHSMSFSIVSSQLEAGGLADPIRTAWMKSGGLSLRNFLGFAKHFRRAGKVEPALRIQFTQRCQHEVCAVDVCVDGGKAVGKTFRDEALGCQVITLVKLEPTEDAEDTRVTFETRLMKLNIVEDVQDASEPAIGIFKSNTAHKSVHFVAERHQMLSEIAAVLTCDSCD